ncbi:hypothetical protein OG592_27275 [Streptomyces avidinii]|uniref:hypothetical protein n=1 Tax=Streptomyces avidinii TaxID=1895 RepID=UPI0038657B25|nr:hypothetical protein OG592_27275 [Streptomyces avidinii]
MNAVQPHLDGTIPTSRARQRAADYDTWVAAVRPDLIAEAKTGKPFLFWQVLRRPHLPLAPDPAHDPGRLAASLHRDGITRTAGYGKTRDRSAVQRWRGSRALIEGRVA